MRIRTVNVADSSRGRALRRFRLPAVVAGCWLASSPAMAGGCFHFGEVVTLTGNYVAMTAPLADGVLRDSRTDAGRRADLLELRSPLCVLPDVISAGVHEAASVQLDCPGLKASEGGLLSLSGRLIGAHTGNGHPPIVLSCTMWDRP
jgi:hypothetical protein